MLQSLKKLIGIEKSVEPNKLELSNGYTNAENMNTDNALFPKDGKQLVKRRKVVGTPFEIIKNDWEEGANCKITLGMFDVMQRKMTEEEALKLIEEKDWEIIANTMSVIAESVNKLMLEDKWEEIRQTTGENKPNL